ncbi:MAG: hypothetical protein AAF513_03145 [Pseudomonadota bacterium]
MSDLLTSDSPFNAEQIDLLRQISGAMIPANEHRPGADDATILADVLATARAHPAGVIAALVEAEAMGLDAFSRSQSAACRTLVSMVIQCYYRDDRVVASLGSEPRPPFPQGYEVDDGDWSMLEPVKARGIIYREV